MTIPLFFGCWGQSGHYLFGPGRSRVTNGRQIEVVDDIHLDANYAPRRDRRTNQLCWSAQAATIAGRNLITYGSHEFPEGYFLRHERGGFTLIQWWDRQQGDDRPGCNSTFLLDGSHSNDTMFRHLRLWFPHVLTNLYRAGVRLVEATR